MAGKKSDNIDKAFLKSLVDATAAGTIVYVSQVQGQPLLSHVPPLIEINPAMLDPNDGTKVAARTTQAAVDYLAAPAAEATVADKASPSHYAILTGVSLPEAKKRGNTAGSGAPTKYPFADMPVGGSFFSANSEHAKGDALKALGSTVSSQNRKYATETGETKTQKRAKRGDDNKPLLDEHGKKIIETVTLPVLKYERKFTIRAVPAGYKSGDWVAPEAGALIGRTV
jgi:hypothetical protein